MILFKDCTVPNEVAVYFLSRHDKYIQSSIKRYGDPRFYYELLSEARLAVVHALQIFNEDGGSSLNNWIRRGIRNAVRNESRAQVRKRKHDTYLDTVNSEAEEFLIEDDNGAKEELDGILNKLIPEHREVLVDRFLGNMTTLEIAEKQKVSQTQVYTLMQNALRSCRHRYRMRK